MTRQVDNIISKRWKLYFEMRYKSADDENEINEVPLTGVIPGPCSHP